MQETIILDIELDGSTYVLNATKSHIQYPLLVNTGSIAFPAYNRPDSMDEPLTHDKLVERVLNGAVMFPNTPGVRDAACEVFRPLIVQMHGKEIIYRCRCSWIVRIDRLQVGNKGFSAKGTPIQQVRDSIMSADLSNSMSFGSTWEGLRLIGKAIGLSMLTDHFYTDPAVVAEVREAAGRNSKPQEIFQILRRAMDL